MKLKVTDGQRARFPAALDEVPDTMAARGLRDGMTWAEAAGALGHDETDDIGCIVRIVAAVVEEEWKR